MTEILYPKTRKLIWTGSGNGELTKKPKNSDETIARIVTKIMKDLPSNYTTEITKN